MKLTEIKTHIYEVDMPRKMGDANSPRGRKRSSNVYRYKYTKKYVNNRGERKKKRSYYNT